MDNEGEDMSENKERCISKEEVEVNVRNVKKGKSAGMDCVYMEMIREGAGELIELLASMLNARWR